MNTISRPRAGGDLAALGASSAAVQFHYDTGNDFFQLWLDKELLYAAALHDPDNKQETLEDAQVARIDYYWNHLITSPGANVLEIGCGWGSALRRAVNNHGAVHATGLTLSAAQREYVNGLATPGVTCFEKGWQVFEPTSTFDAIVSIEAIEHFAKFDLSREEKVGVYREFFERCHAWLKPGGSLGLQFMAYGSAGRENHDEFIANQIFPESEIPELFQVIEGSARRFEVITIRNDRSHYVLTLREWLRRLKHNRKAATDLVGADTVRRFEDWLRLSWYIFDCGVCDLHRIIFRRIDAPKLPV
jgi:cyclopropane-fatty-acyl-phospholipid synthase